MENVPLYCYSTEQWARNKGQANAMGIYIVFKSKSRPYVVAVKTEENTNLNFQGVKLGMSVLKIQKTNTKEIVSKTGIEQELKNSDENSKLNVFFGFEEKDEEKTRVWVYPPWVSAILNNSDYVDKSKLIRVYSQQKQQETKGIEFNVKLAADESSLFHPISKGPWGLNDTKIKEFMAKCHYYVCRAGYKTYKKRPSNAPQIFFLGTRLVL